MVTAGAGIAWMMKQEMSDGSKPLLLEFEVQGYLSAIPVFLQ
jgi:hypothetical protein